MVDDFLMTTTPFSGVAPPDLSSPPYPRSGISTLPYPIRIFFSKFATGLPSPCSGDPASGVLKPLCHPIITLPVSSLHPDDLNYAGDVNNISRPKS
uniref:Uncharacterized protein n=1 Tax=Brassica oleracea TaxID=3712 RepID=A0A3P6FQG9_BRAOL|nr:unnamed protein product [Brassica oleracea]